MMKLRSIQTSMILGYILIFREYFKKLLLHSRSSWNFENEHAPEEINEDEKYFK